MHNLSGAVRLYLASAALIERDPARPVDESLPPLRVGAWALWARASEARDPMEIESLARGDSVDQAGQGPGGDPGRTVVIDLPEYPGRDLAPQVSRVAGAVHMAMAGRLEAGWRGDGILFDSEGIAPW